MRRFAVRALAIVAGLLVILAIGAYLSLRRSLPMINGTTTVTGISAAVEIVRDADAIPHIFAATRLDALFGLGYVHAQDRLWQMEFQRRIGFGRLSEIFGSATLPQDRFLRTVGFGRAARSAWDTTPEWAKTQVNAYVSGVNAFISSHHGTELPPEFSLLRFEPEAWSGPDVIVWVKMMAWDLSANYSFEMLRRDLAGAVGAERMHELMPPYPAHGLSILGGSAPNESGGSGLSAKARSAKTDGSNGSAGSRESRGSDAQRSYPTYLTYATYPTGSVAEGVGSNNWVVDGTLTASGKPLLANDPHLGTRAPSTWYLAHMSAGDFDVIGATLPGAPAVALGRNKYIAWGATNVAADVEDLYREHIDADGKTAEFRGASEPLTVVPEIISVRSGPPAKLAVRVSRHGPLISDALNANAASPAPGAPRASDVEPLAFRWTALDREDLTITAFLKLNDAHDWDQFTGALRDFVVPSQNFVFADVNGHIGYYAPGHIPIRASGDGSMPADGWTGDAEWTGWIPFDELPHLYDPPDHMIVTANDRPAPADYKHFLGLEWPEPYRAQRIVDLLAQSGRPLTPDDFAHIQADTLSLHAKSLAPVLIAHAHPSAARDRQALDVLRTWNFDARGDSAAEAIFESWFNQLAIVLVRNQLVPRVADLYRARFSYVTRFMVHTLTSGTADAAVTTALHEAIDALTHRLGGDMTVWRWDAVHHAVFPHAGLDAIAVLRPFVSRSVPNGGDWSTVDVGPVDVEHPYEQRSVPGYREIIDLSPANDSRFLNDLGESGHPLSPHYDDFLPDWRAVKHKKMRMERTEIDRGAIGHLRLAPQ